MSQTASERGKRADEAALHSFVNALKEMQGLTVKVRLDVSGGITE